MLNAPADMSPEREDLCPPVPNISRYSQSAAE